MIIWFKNLTPGQQVAYIFFAILFLAAVKSFIGH